MASGRLAVRAVAGCGASAAQADGAGQDRHGKRRCLAAGRGTAYVNAQVRGGHLMAEATEGTRHGFTREQIDFLQETFSRRSAQGFDRPTQMWLIGGLAAAGLAAFGILWAEIGSVRDDLRAEIRENRAAIGDLAKGLARLEAVLQERLPMNR